LGVPFFFRLLTKSSFSWRLCSVGTGSLPFFSPSPWSDFLYRRNLFTGKKNTKNKTVIDFKKQIELGHQNSTAAFWPVAAASVL
jgi:hypothetical protein